MNKTIKNILQVIVSLGLGLLVFYIVYKDIKMEDMKECLQHASWGYILFPISLCLLSSWVRALRWDMLIEPVDHKPANKNTFCAVVFGYFVNHILPRAGEVARCGVLTKYEKIEFSKLVGTVITERAIDLIITLLIVLLTICLQFSVFQEMLSSISWTDKITGLFSNPILWIAIITCAIVFFLLRKRLASTKLFEKIISFANGMKNGLVSFTKVKNKPLFIFYSLLIFFMYYLMLYCSFWVFDFTEHLSPKAGLLTYVFGSIGMIAPVQGGIGTYEYMTSQALAIYGISEHQAATFALLSHIVEIIVNCVAGFICFLLLPRINKTNDKK